MGGFIGLNYGLCTKKARHTIESFINSRARSGNDFQKALIDAKHCCPLRKYCIVSNQREFILISGICKDFYGEKASLLFYSQERTRLLFFYLNYPEMERIQALILHLRILYRLILLNLLKCRPYDGIYSDPGKAPTWIGDVSERENCLYV